MEKTIKYPNGNSYEGAVNDRKLPHGMGTMKYSDGSVYVGRWNFGAWYGEGTFIDGRRVYVGTWVGTKKSEYVTLVENGEAMRGKMDEIGFLGPNGERLPEPIVEQPTEDKSEPVAHNATRNDAPPYVRLGGKTILFGTYPQTIKADNVTITDATNENGYFLGSDGEWYAKVVANPYDSDFSYKFSNDASVTSGSTYYFKVEPIKWRILSTDGDTALILCDSVIANHRYDNDSNNYMNSEIRQWLNEQFYKTTFTDMQREIILTTTVDNSVASTGYSSNQYACEDTEDKVFLLSYKEVTNSTYGFNDTTARRMLTSDYSRATGSYMSAPSDYHYGNGWWWLRSPHSDFRYFARLVNCDGSIDYGDVSGTLFGIVPALQIQLN